MPDPLSEAWLVSAREVIEALPPVGDVDATVQYTVTGGPDGKRLIGVVISEGIVTGIEAGKIQDTDFQVSLSHEICVEILEGSLTPEAAFMRGGLKVDGDHAIWLVDLRHWRRQALEALLSI